MVEDPAARPHVARGFHFAASTLTKIDRPLARANTQIFASGRGQGRAAVLQPGAAYPCSARLSLGTEEVTTETVRSNPAGSTPVR